MIRYFLLLLLLPTTFALLGQNEPADLNLSWEVTEARWENHTDYEGRFGVYSPGDFWIKQDSIKTPIGTLVYHTHYLQPPADNSENEVYMITYVDYPEGTLHQDSTELITALFDETQSAAQNSVRGELLFSRDGELQGFPYRYWRIDYLNSRASIRTKAIIAGNRFYTIQTVSQRARGLNKATDRFIDSFRVFD